jgi:hypothetical protein
VSKAKTALRRRKSKAAPAEQPKVTEGAHRLGAFVSTFGPLPAAPDGTPLDPYIRDQQRAARAAVREDKRKGQRAAALARRKIDDAKYDLLASTTLSDKEIATKLGVHATTLSRHKKRMRLAGSGPSGSQSAK